MKGMVGIEEDRMEKGEISTITQLRQVDMEVDHRPVMVIQGLRPWMTIAGLSTLSHPKQGEQL